jgi:hypothetical protein
MRNYLHLECFVVFTISQSWLCKGALTLPFFSPNEVCSAFYFHSFVLWSLYLIFPSSMYMLLCIAQWNLFHVQGWTVLFTFFPYFTVEGRLWFCVRMSAPPNNIWSNWQIFINLGTDIITFEATSPWYFSEFLTISNTNMCPYKLLRCSTSAI